MASNTTEAAGNAADASAPGMPQLDFSTFGNQIFWLVVTLVVIYLILSRIALPRIAAVLAERQGTISHDIAAADELKSKAAAAEEAYNKALADARVEAARITEATKAEIKAELQVAIDEADAKIAEKAAASEAAIAEIRASALDSVDGVAKATAAELVSALGGKAEAKKVNAAVAEQLKG